MHRPARATLVLLLAAVHLALQGPHANADGGCGSAGRPACTVLRPAGPASLGPALLGSGDCVVEIGGLASTEESTVLAFEPLLAGLEGVAVSVVRYDSLGRIAVAADAVRDHVDAISPSCAAIHLVAHSMGGVVVDRAFSMGLSSRDRVVTYVPLASPHNGSTIARSLCGLGEFDAGYADLLRAVALVLGQPDPSTAAICDLARVGGSRPPRGVTTARLRLVTDPLVPRRDHAAPHRDVRELIPVDRAELEGHGGILRSDQARRIVERSVIERVVPPDDRDALYRAGAEVAGAATDLPLAALHEAIGGTLRTGAILTALGRRILEALGVR